MQGGHWSLLNTQNLFYALHFCPVVANLYEMFQSDMRAFRW